jgi:hypothetical protein
MAVHEITLWWERENERSGCPATPRTLANWAEPLGVISLVVEGVLLIIAAVSLTTVRRRVGQPPAALSMPPCDTVA